MFKSFFAEMKAAYQEDMAIHKEAHIEACKKAEGVGRNCVGVIYHPAYAVGGATALLKDTIDRAGSTKVGQSIKDIAEDVKFSAKEGYKDGKEAKQEQIAMNRAIKEWSDDIENTVFSDQF